jgi:hypothetical protein
MCDKGVRKKKNGGGGGMMMTMLLLVGCVFRAAPNAFIIPTNHLHKIDLVLKFRSVAAISRTIARANQKPSALPGQASKQQ